MYENQLVCLTIGDTPTTQFISWRLSLTNVFLIQVADCISSDGLVSWKSTKLGLNFYKPNLFYKDMETLEKDFKRDSKSDLYKVDIVIISCISFKEYQKHCLSLSQIINEKTIIIADANFCVDIELCLYTNLQNIFGGILSILCDVETRNLSSGSYALVSDCIRVFLGVTYISNEPAYAEDIIKFKQLNNKKLKHQIEDKKSVLNIFYLLIREHTTKYIEIISTESNEMALKVWLYIIPRISLNTISIIFDQLDYSLLLQQNFARAIFQELVDELIVLSYRHSHILPKQFMKKEIEITDSTDPNVIVEICQNINYDTIEKLIIDRKRELDRFTINEYPEFLTLSFEAYCFYHKLEYPAYILLYQPIFLADFFKVKCSSLKFLFGFYSRLLAISGYAIEGGTSIATTPDVLFGKRLHITNSVPPETTKKDNKTRGKRNRNREGKPTGAKKGKSKNIRSSEKSPISTSRNNKSSEELQDEQIQKSLEDLFIEIASVSSGSKSTDDGDVKNKMKEGNGNDAEYWSSGDDISDSEKFLNTLSNAELLKLNTKYVENYRKNEQNILKLHTHEDFNEEKGRGTGTDDFGPSNYVDPNMSVYLPNFSTRPTRYKQKQANIYYSYANSETPAASLRAYSNQITDFEKEIRSHNFTSVPKFHGNELTVSPEKNKQLITKDVLEKRKQLKSIMRACREHNVTQTYQFGNDRYSAKIYDNDKLLHNYIDLISSVNMGGILDLTTSRYGSVDTAEKIEQDCRTKKKRLAKHTQLLLTSTKSDETEPINYCLKTTKK
ncbi:uncharacterized protein SCODWIG_03852 [Saccharomycodes ludwigii]|uniref:Outer spore wall protein 2 n=1 Tax=Saccharomycodes ludwigii TaxID=36035 RepID=A0A376BD84_9ASCO|nr:hypothetical protein SCDLUD_000676 [Saccharomycodes ludwigii]KAH3903065.1 hypothetical protein SCDLUD_000676 [Saccharomycodes ludwigii]SSD62090.1 uncharacterized protein SCODWIG_03852 [Saccharomycodes ludwigii]